MYQNLFVLMMMLKSAFVFGQEQKVCSGVLQVHEIPSQNDSQRFMIVTPDWSQLSPRIQEEMVITFDLTLTGNGYVTQVVVVMDKTNTNRMDIVQEVGELLLSGSRFNSVDHNKRSTIRYSLRFRPI